MRRFAIFLLYDPEGFVDNAVIHTLRGLRPHAEQIFVVSNGYLQAESRARLEAEVDEVFERPNTGFDVGAYRSALGRIGFDRLEEFDELLLINYTFFGPIDTFDELFERMDARTVDFWGMTSHVEVTPHPIVGKGTMPEHLQSYWLAFRKSLFATGDFQSYWSLLPDANSYHDVITIFETELTEHFANLGYAWEAAYPNDKYDVLNVSMEAPIALMDDGAPMFKRRLYFHDVVDMDQRDVSGAEVTEYVLSRGFNRDILIDGIIRRTPARSLATGLGLQILHKDANEDDVLEPGVNGVLVRPSKGFWRDVCTDPSSFTGVDVVVLEGQTPERKPLGQEAPFDSWFRRGRRFDRAMNAISGHRDAIANAFAKDARLGVVVPLADHHGTTALGDGWHGCKDAAGYLANRLGVIGPLERHSPMVPSMGVFAVRMGAVAPVAERVVHAGGWDLLADEFGGHERLAFLLDLLVADIARTTGFVTAEAATMAEFKKSAVVLAQKFAETASRFESTPPAPFHGALKHPGAPLRAKVGARVRAVSPGLARGLLVGERIVKSGVRKVTGKDGQRS